MGIWTSYGIGRSAPDEGDVTMLPTAYALDGTLPGVVYCHPSGGSALSASNPVDRAGEWSLVRGLAEHRPLVVPDLGGPESFGNDIAVARLDDARRLLQRYGAAPGPVALVASSMGATVALRYAAAHRDRVSAVVGVVPLVDLAGFYAADAGGLGAAVAAAWGLRPGDPLPPGASPLDHVAELRGLRLQCWTASDDPFIPPAGVASFVAALGPPAEVHDLGAHGHGEDAIGAVPLDAVLAFVEGTAAGSGLAVA